jgi:hypothetical protein
MPFPVAAKNQMLDGLTVDRVRLHSGDPGADGTANQVGSLTAATFAAAASGERALSAQVNFAGTVYKGKAQITGDATANAAGEYTLTTGTKLTLTDS